MLTVLFVPGISGAGTVPRWGFAAIALPLIISRVTSPFTDAHVFGLAFLLYAAISVLWSHPYDGLDALIKLIIIAQAFVLGTKLESFKPVIIGFGLGIWVNSALMLAGFDLPHTEQISAGLFVNTNVLGEIAGLVLVAAIIYRIWWLVPGILPAFWMAQCRGAFVAVGCAGLIWLWPRSRTMVIGIAIVTTIAIFNMPIDLRSMQQRFQMWGDILPHLTVLGSGLGSTFSAYPLYASMDTLAMRPEHLHNDWLEYAFELGVVGSAALLGFLACTRSIVLATLFIEACVGFPLHMVATAILGSIVAGHAARSRPCLRHHLATWRISLRARALAKPHR